LEYKFIPNVRTAFTTKDGLEFDLPAVWGEWLDQLPPADQESIWQQGALNRKLCRSLWKYLGRTDPVPRLLYIFVNSEDLMRVFPEIPKK
jgi:hypothetical protein